MEQILFRLTLLLQNLFDTGSMLKKPEWHHLKINMWDWGQLSIILYNLPWVISALKYFQLTLSDLLLANGKNNLLWLGDNTNIWTMFIWFYLNSWFWYASGPWLEPYLQPKLAAREHHLCHGANLKMTYRIDLNLDKLVRLEHYGLLLHFCYAMKIVYKLKLISWF